MKRTLGLIALIIFLVYTGAYIFVYLFRAFRLPGPAGGTVQIWHGDPFARAILVSVFFMIGLLIILFIMLMRPGAHRTGSITVRSDLWEWLTDQGERTNETPESIGERAIAIYRARLEGASPVP
ncbi:MAG: hypothetical protein U9N84_15090 [Actinomycetota bacterium]|nr:hypothetical protein [Actinomycetota bacterium]